METICDHSVSQKQPTSFKTKKNVDFRHWLIAFFFLTNAFHLVSAKATEIQTVTTPKALINHLLDQIIEDTLLVLDIDDTLLMSEEPLLRAHLLDFLLNTIQNHFRLTKEETLSFLQFCLERTSHPLGRGQPVFPEWLSFIRTCFAHSVKIIALTQVCSGKSCQSLPQLSIHYEQQVSREDSRFEDLRLAGLQFDGSFLEELGAELVVVSRFPFSCDHPYPVFKKGILLANCHPKGEVLAAFLHTVDWKPKKIIFVDNVLDNVYSVQKNVAQLVASFEGIHFTYVAEKLCTIDPNRLQMQINWILSRKEWLSLNGEWYRLAGQKFRKNKENRVLEYVVGVLQSFRDNPFHQHEKLSSRHH